MALTQISSATTRGMSSCQKSRIRRRRRPASSVLVLHGAHPATCTGSDGADAVLVVAVRRPDAHEPATEQGLSGDHRDDGHALVPRIVGQQHRGRHRAAEGRPSPRYRPPRPRRARVADTHSQPAPPGAAASTSRPRVLPRSTRRSPTPPTSTTTTSITTAAASGSRRLRSASRAARAITRTIGAASAATTRVSGATPGIATGAGPMRARTTTRRAPCPSPAARRRRAGDDPGHGRRRGRIGHAHPVDRPAALQPAEPDEPGEQHALASTRLP